MELQIWNVFAMYGLQIWNVFAIVGQGEQGRHLVVFAKVVSGSQHIVRMEAFGMARLNTRLSLSEHVF